MHPDPRLRPDVNSLLTYDRIKKIISQRRLNLPFRKMVRTLPQLHPRPNENYYQVIHFLNLIHLQKRAARFTMDKLRLIKVYICNVVMSVVSLFQLKHLKNPTPSIALTSTPTVSSFISQPSDSSFLRLDDSNIDFEDSPNRSRSKSFGNLSPMMNSTPLNHYNSHGSFRRARNELSRTGLV